MSIYVETEADHAFTAFLAALTPGKVQRDRSAMFSPSERKRAAFLKQKHDTEVAAERRAEIATAKAMARELAFIDTTGMTQDRALQIAIAAQNRSTE